MAIREGAWDCEVCDRRRNRGPEKCCAGCGHPRGAEVELYLPEDAGEVADAADLERARQGPDWHCEHCGGDNRTGYAHCTGCGAPGAGASTRRVTVYREEAARRPASSSSSPPSRRPSKARRKQLKKAYRRGRRSSRRPLAIGCIALLAVVALLTYLGRTSAETATVSGVAWERQVEVEQLLLVTEEGKPGEVPAGARLLDSPGHAETRTVTERVQVGTKRVKVGVRDLGNGFFEDVYEEQPVYETRRREVAARAPPAGATVRYQVRRWTSVRQERAAGRDRAPRWPAASLGPDERTGERTESYTVYFSAPGGRRLTYRPGSQDEWLRFRPGASYRVEASRTGRIKTLSPQ